MRENITTGEAPFRKAWLRSLVERIEIDDEAVRIIGGKAPLGEAIAGESAASETVRRRVLKWRSQGDSNPCFRRERATSWTARRWEQRIG